MTQEIAKIKNVYLMNEERAIKAQLTNWGASYFMGKIIVDLEYDSGARQSTSLNSSKTALSLKKNDKIKVNINGRYIDSIIYNGKKLKGSWMF